MRNHRLNALAFVFLVASPLPAQQTPDLLTAIDREIRHAVRFWDVPGCSVVVVQKDRVIFIRGFGNRQVGAQSPVTPDTVFPIASCTKSFTATALAILVTEKKLRWDDPVRQHLPEFHLSNPHADALVTIRDLLCHRTGVASHDFLWYRSSLSSDELIGRIAHLPVSGQFRSSFAYQNLMVMAAGQIVACYHPRGWKGFIEERIFQPLGMTTSYATEPAERTVSLALGHIRTVGGIIEPCEPYRQTTPNPAGSIYLSARDLGRWLQFQLGNGTWRGRRLVSEQALTETHQPQSIIPPGDVTRRLSPESIQLTYGMGWVISDYRGVKLLSHAGVVDGFRCHFTLFPDHGIGLGILANLHATRMNLALSNRLTDLILGLEERDWHGYYRHVEEEDLRTAREHDQERQQRRAQGKPRSLPLALYAGVYNHPAYGIMTIQLGRQGLLWKWSSFERELRHLSDDVFEVPNVGHRDHDLVFVVRAGKVVAARLFDIEFSQSP